MRVLYAAGFLLFHISVHLFGAELIIVDAPDSPELEVQLFRSEQDKPDYREKVPCTNNTAVVPFKNITKGVYRISLDSAKKLSPSMLKAFTAEFPLEKDLYVSAEKGVLKTGSLSFRISDIINEKGILHVAVFRLTNGKPSDKPFAGRKIDLKTNTAVCTFPNLPFGEYAASLMQDLNGNSIAEKGEAKFPEYSGSGKTGTLTAEAGMKFRETVFLINSSERTADVSLEYGFFRTGTLIIRVKGLKNTNGQILTNLFNQEKGFPLENKKAFQTLMGPIPGKDMSITFNDIPFGTYAAGVLHDEDSNFKMKSNLFGVPREGTGSSNDAKGRFGPPSFEAASFSFDRDVKEIIINMAY